jgi:hypothetical protein
MYLTAAKYARILFWAAIVAGFLTFLWPTRVRPWIPISIAGVCGVLYLYVKLYPRRTQRLEWRCPGCGWRPFAIRAWKCKKCGHVWDTFATEGVCPQCGHEHEETACVRCRNIYPNKQWRAPDAE